ncbi:MAG: hypothetical protein ACI909_001096 [Planctomycetota bacterium]|jgi:uncharacterized protein YcsI (UPF0317 family)
MNKMHPLDNPRDIRRAISHGQISGPTSGLAPGYIQCNILILPGEYAEDFAHFCELNRHACPVLARSELGDPALPALGDSIDIRRDLSAYSVFEQGKLTQTKQDINELWRDDFVTFAFGCSFSFEQVLEQEGVNLDYLQRGDSAALFYTNIDAVPTGPFRGKIAVSMRPLKPEDAIKAVLVTARYPDVHGEPIHIGHPEMIGISDINKPEQTLTQTRVMEDELPVFWACGVTSQLAVEQAKIPICITHASAHMLITDLRLDKLGK